MCVGGRMCVCRCCACAAGGEGGGGLCVDAGGCVCASRRELWPGKGVAGGGSRALARLSLGCLGACGTRVRMHAAWVARRVSARELGLREKREATRPAFSARGAAYLALKACAAGATVR